VYIIQFWAIEFIGTCALLRQRQSARTGEWFPSITWRAHVYHAKAWQSLAAANTLHSINLCLSRLLSLSPSTDRRLQNNNCHISDTILWRKHYVSRSRLQKLKVILCWWRKNLWANCTVLGNLYRPTSGKDNVLKSNYKLTAGVIIFCCSTINITNLFYSMSSQIKSRLLCPTRYRRGH